MSLKLCEEFVSIQGEGSRCGILSYFIRLAGCNLACSFCDEPKHKNKSKFYQMTTDDMVRRVLNSQVAHAVITGGEPTMQKDVSDLIHKLKASDIEVSVETNGYDLDMVNEADLITWSPKYNFEEAFLNKTEINGIKNHPNILGSEIDIKIPYPSIDDDRLLDYIKFLGSFINRNNTRKPRIFLMPINDALELNKANSKAAFDFIYKHRVARFGNEIVYLNLNTQVHKVLDLR